MKAKKLIALAMVCSMVIGMAGCSNSSESSSEESSSTSIFVQDDVLASEPVEESKPEPVQSSNTLPESYSVRMKPTISDDVTFQFSVEDKDRFYLDDPSEVPNEYSTTFDLRGTLSYSDIINTPDGTLTVTGATKEYYEEKLDAYEYVNKSSGEPTIVGDDPLFTFFGIGFTPVELSDDKRTTLFMELVKDNEIIRDPAELADPTNIEVKAIMAKADEEYLSIDDQKSPIRLCMTITCPNGSCEIRVGEDRSDALMKLIELGVVTRDEAHEFTKPYYLGWFSGEHFVLKNSNYTLVLSEESTGKGISSITLIKN